MRYEAIVMGVSSGGMSALKFIFSVLPKSFNTPIIIVQHVGPHSNNQWIQLLNNTSALYIKEPDEKEKIERGSVYIAPSNYHLLIEKNKTFSLSIEGRVNYARPSIDVLFESAAEVYTDRLIGVVLTGASNDGTKGLKKIVDCGGLAIIQDPTTAESSFMPTSAAKAVNTDFILPLQGITDLLIQLDKGTSKNSI